MKKSILLLSSLTLLFISCKKNVQDLPFTDEQKASPVIQEEFRSGIPVGYTACGAPVETPLLANKTTVAGSVTVWNDAVNIYVSYQTTGNYKLKATKLFVGDCNLIPVSSKGSPKPSNFPYQNDHGAGVTIFTKVIPISSLPAGCLCIAANADIITTSSSCGHSSYSQTGWAQGTQIKPNSSSNWGMKFGFCPASCNTDPDPGR